MGGRVPHLADVARRGFSLVEVLIAVALLVVAVFALVVAAGSSHRLSVTTQEYSIAYSAMRAKIEVRAHEFSKIYADYRFGGARGNTWTVSALPSVDGGPQGQLFFPEAPLRQGEAAILRETFVDAEMGMPLGGRDLNGDGAIDDNDRANDYTLLPIKLTIRWAGSNGETSLTVSTWMAAK